MVVLPEPPLPATAIFRAPPFRFLLDSFAGHGLAASAPASLRFSSALHRPCVLLHDPQFGRHHPFGRRRDTPAELALAPLAAAAQLSLAAIDHPLPVLQQALPEGPQLLQPLFRLFQLPLQELVQAPQNTTRYPFLGDLHQTPDLLQR